MAVGFVAVVIGSAGIGASAGLLRLGRPTPGTGESADRVVLQASEDPVYEVGFSEEPIPIQGALGHYLIRIATNLPDGTLVADEETDTLGGGGGCCRSVANGVIDLPLVNNGCVGGGSSLH